MLTTNLFIAIISLCFTCFALGYTVGSKSKNIIDVCYAIPVTGLLHIQHYDQISSLPQQNTA